ncbi:Tn3 family transposase [Candidatus Woesearchaeota archaeon]|nr:Tn3 family transposase [Candidatus Woesearchaeota archaeon]
MIFITGMVNSSFILKKLSSHRRIINLYNAFKELGRVARTNFVISYSRSNDVKRKKMLL